MKKNIFKCLSLYFPKILLFLICVISFFSYLNANDINVWWVEMFSVIFLVILFSFTYKKFSFSNISYFILFCWCFLQIIGATYTFEKVPFDFITNLFGFTRNNFDRLAHLIVGCNSFLIAEFLYRKKILNSKIISSVFGVVFIMAMANFWELIEWIYAEVSNNNVGLAFLGSQGDIWDAQKDMLMDNIGAIFASFLFYKIFPNNNKIIKK